MVNFFSTWVKNFSFYMWLFGIMFFQQADTLAGSTWQVMYYIITGMFVIYEYSKPYKPVHDYIRYWILYDQSGVKIFKETALNIKENYNL